MFRIKPTRNQTTAKHVNLSPYPNNLISNLNLIQNKPNNKPIQIVNTKPNNRIQSKKQINQQNNNFKNNQSNNPVSKISNNFYVQARKTGQITNKLNLHKQIINRQKIKQSLNTYKDKDQTNKNINQVNKNNLQIIQKHPERPLLKRTQNKQHKLKIQNNNNKQLQNIVSKPIANLNKEHIVAHIRKQSAAKKQTLLKQQNQQLINQKQQKIFKEVKQIKIEKKIYNKDRQYQKIQKVNKVQQKVIQITKQQNQYNKQTLNKQIKSFNNIQTNIPIKQDKIETITQQKNEKQKQMQQILIKIQKRRQARLQQKKRQQQLQQKRKQNQQRALQYLNQRNHREHSTSSHNQGVTGMLKLNDQLMHFSLAQSIMDIQIKKLLKTNFNDFPNASQIKYQVQQLQRINMSYQMIRFDQTNPLRNGLKNYRVQIFNRIGDLIMKAQQQGYTNPNFHILQHDGRINSGPNNLIPKAIKGVPQQNYKNFIKYIKNEEQQQCTICLGQIKIGQICANIQCGHKFHDNCIKQWIKSSANCPTCRFNIKFGTKAK